MFGFGFLGADAAAELFVRESVGGGGSGIGSGGLFIEGGGVVVVIIGIGVVVVVGVFEGLF